MLPGGADGEGSGGAGQRLMYAFEKRRCLSPDGLRFVIKRLEHENNKDAIPQ
jgi:hypothetical protein